MRKRTDKSLGLFSLVAAIIMWLLPKTPTIVIISLVVIFLLLLYPVWKFWWIEKSSWRRFMAILLVAFGLCAFGYFILPKDQPLNDAKKPVVFEPFAPIYEIYKAQLGKPQGQAEREGGVYYAVHQQAYVVYLKRLLGFYILDRRNPQNLKWTRHDDPDWDTDPKWSNDEKLRELFRMAKNLPKNLGPPWSGVAKLWYSDPKSWRWIGWRKWHCIHSGDVYYQEFEHGFIMGGFPLNPDLKKEEQGAALFILTDNHDDHRWTTRESPLNPPKCITPP